MVCGSTSHQHLYCCTHDLLATLVNEREFALSEEAHQWLAGMKCPQEYIELFEKHGYFKLSFIATMTAEVLLGNLDLCFFFFPFFAFQSVTVSFCH